jgi:hypothetical protein
MPRLAPKTNADLPAKILMLERFYPQSLNNSARGTRSFLAEVRSLMFATEMAKSKQSSL